MKNEKFPQQIEWSSISNICPAKISYIFLDIRKSSRFRNCLIFGKPLDGFFQLWYSLPIQLYPPYGLFKKHIDINLWKKVSIGTFSSASSMLLCYILLKISKTRGYRMGTFTQNWLMISHEEVNIEMKRVAYSEPFVKLSAIISSGKVFSSTFEWKY